MLIITTDNEFFGISIPTDRCDTPIFVRRPDIVMLQCLSIASSIAISIRMFLDSFVSVTGRFRYAMPAFIMNVFAQEMTLKNLSRLNVDELQQLTFASRKLQSEKFTQRENFHKRTFFLHLKLFSRILIDLPKMKCDLIYKS